MKIRHTTGGKTDKVDMQMTPMIDIVFQLLTFFLFSFKIVSPEGDFNIKMPVAAASASTAELDNLPLKIKLTAAADGSLRSITMGDRNLGTSFAALRSAVISAVGRDTGPESNAAKSEVELDCDYQLAYENVTQAIDAVSGYREGGQLVKLVQKIKFSPPKKPQ
jgi:biopolymer transport protein ExbD